MFRQVVARARTGLRRSFGTSPFPKGLSQGGHRDMTPREKNYFKTWLKQPAAMPIMFITTFVVSMGAYKLAFVDSQAPNVHWTEEERSTIDYLQNDRSVDRIEKWKQSIWVDGVHKILPFSWKFTNCDSSKPDNFSETK